MICNRRKDPYGITGMSWKHTDDQYVAENVKILMKIAYWARKYPELYEPGPARNTIANHLAELFTKLDAKRVG